MSKKFKEGIAIDHFHVNALDLFHCSHAATRYSAGADVDSTALDNAIEQFEACWLAPFLPPGAVQEDSVLGKPAFKDHITAHDMMFRSIPPC